jgi:hypothetical protein
MTKDQLIAMLQGIEGNPVIVVPASDHSYRSRVSVEDGSAILWRGELSEDDDRLELEEGERRIPIVVIG